MKARRLTPGQCNAVRAGRTSYYCFTAPFALVALCLCLVCARAARAQEQHAAANPADEGIALYHRLRGVGLDPAKIYKVRDAEFDREDLHFALKEGTIAFVEPVAGHVTGALFIGEGEVLIVPPDQVERASLALFTKAAVLEESFQSAYFRFFDDQLIADLSPYFRPPDDPQAFATHWGTMVKDLSDTDALRLLMEFTNAGPEGKPQAFLHARVSNQRRGTFDVVFDASTEEQIAVGQVAYNASATYYDVWTSFAMRSRRQRAEQSDQTVADDLRPLRIPNCRITMHVHPPEGLEAEAEVSLLASRGGIRTIIFELSRYLKVSSVTSGGRPLEFIQNEALAGTDLARKGNDVVAVLFPQELPQGTPVEVKLNYSGSVLSDAGGGLLRVGARGNWYPSLGASMTSFELEFRYPAGWTLLATGKQQSLRTENNEQAARWKTERPIPVAGFNLGHYVSERAQAGSVVVESYASRGVERTFSLNGPNVAPVPPLQPPSWHSRGRGPLPSIPEQVSPTPSDQAKKVAQDSAKAIEFMSGKFGPYPYSALELTQMPGALSQGWPGLVFLSSYVFVPSEERPRALDTELGRVFFDRLMLAHETAHQWWGDAVPWKSYRDQWISEGLANYSALLSFEAERPEDMKIVLNFYRKHLTEKNDHGEENWRAGPVTLGQRLDCSHFPQGYELIAYGRGTWLIHMLREMLRDATRSDSMGRSAGQAASRAEEKSDALFYSVLRDLQSRFAGRQLSTLDLQRAFEKVMPKQLQYEGRKSLDWFFEGWVNGMAIPSYELQGVRLAPHSGRMTATGTLLQKNAPDSLITAVPLYAAMEDGSLRFLAQVFADGEETSLSLPVPRGTRKLVIDPEHTILTRP